MPADDDHGIGQQMEEGERVTIASQSASADDVNPGWSARQAVIPVLIGGIYRLIHHLVAVTGQNGLNAIHSVGFRRLHAIQLVFFAHGCPFVFA